LITADNDEFEVTTEGKNMLQGKAYLYEETVPYVQEIPYVTFTADAEQTLRFGTYNFYYDNDEETPAESDFASFEYSINGQSWRNISSFTTLTFGGEKGVLRIRGKNLNGTSNFRATDDYIFTQIEFGNTNPVACSGDIRTLIDFENYTTVLTENARFVNLFRGCYQLTSTPELPATTLAEGCYYSMFSGCTSLTQTPELPATTLARSCYGEMFRECTSLTQAPELLATNLTDYCYWYMFFGCSNLNYIKMMATNISAFECLNYWVNGVSSTGIFVKNKDASWDIIANCGIPSGWTVETASE
jgi:hypothetical protein